MFPVPDPIPADPTLTMEELYAGYCPPGNNPGTVLTLRVDRLRHTLSMFIIERGYLPA